MEPLSSREPVHATKGKEAVKKKKKCKKQKKSPRRHKPTTKATHRLIKQEKSLEAVQLGDFPSAFPGAPSREWVGVEVELKR